MDKARKLEIKDFTNEETRENSIIIRGAKHHNSISVLIHHKVCVQSVRG